jgi:hypothetical protein
MLSKNKKLVQLVADYRLTVQKYFIIKSQEKLEKFAEALLP